MKIAIAQTKSVQGDISKNISLHKAWIAKAAELNAHLICFPELSLTGYAPTLAKELAMPSEDHRLSDFQLMSDKFDITIAIGLPLQTPTKPSIGMAIFQPNNTCIIYKKRILHQDELPYFSPGNNQTMITIDHLKIAPAICYEANQDSHWSEARKLGMNLYLTSVAKDQAGLNKAYKYFEKASAKHQTPIVMANAIGPSDHFISGGQSAVWNKKGQLTGQLSSTTEGILIYDTQDGKVTKVEK